MSWKGSDNLDGAVQGFSCGPLRSYSRRATVPAEGEPTSAYGVVQNMQRRFQIIGILSRWL